jgi:hypothetical protein
MAQLIDDVVFEAELIGFLAAKGMHDVNKVAVPKALNSVAAGPKRSVVTRDHRAVPRDAQLPRFVVLVMGMVTTIVFEMAGLLKKRGWVPVMGCDINANAVIVRAWSVAGVRTKWLGLTALMVNVAWAASVQA